ncbi:MAG TPA: 6-bladed beta-propeller [Saprospiraceae bacterium]|nr:6-bladed beta-propeller [Saprospiraceae bacterium]HMP12634.1 6-bladed beta-propeller [Saprospiraceae bacterium]
MMHPYQYLVCCLAFLFTFGVLGCRVANSNEQHAHDDIETIFIDLQKFTTISEQHFWSAVDAVPLQFVPESAMDRVEKIIATKHLLIVYNILDISNTKSILIFNNKGEFLKKIDANQPGPGNFSYLQDLYLHGDTLLEFMDNIRAKSFFYDTSGMFLKSASLNIPAAKFAPMGSKYLLHRGNALHFDELGFNDNILLLDTTTGQVIDARAPIQEVFADRGFHISGYFFPTSDHGFLSCDIANDTIYKCNGNEIHPLYLLKFSNEPQRKASIAQLLEEKNKKAQDFNLAVLNWMNNPDIIATPELIHDTPDDLFLGFRYQRQHHLFRYDKQHKTGRLFLLKDIRLWPVYDGYEGKALMVVSRPDVQKALLEKYNYNNLPQAIKNTFERVNENSNPVILLMDLQALTVE